MCTLTIVPTGKNNFIATFNRDEDPKRPALSPEKKLVGNFTKISPFDIRSGGTWIGVSSDRFALFLMNGGYEKHNPKEYPNAKSRGLLVNEFLSKNRKELKSFIKGYSFNGYEPFTLVMVIFGDTAGLDIIEIVWDGSDVNIHPHDAQPRIWSSSTLYNQSLKNLKEQRFRGYLLDGIKTPESIEILHRSMAIEQPKIEVDAKDIKTVSLSQIVVSQKGMMIHFNYQDFFESQNNTFCELIASEYEFTD